MQRSPSAPFRSLALVALVPVVSCTLTADYQPERVTGPLSPDGEAGLVETLPALREPDAGEREANGEADLGGAAEVTGSSEAPVPDIALAASEPTGASSGASGSSDALSSGASGASGGAAGASGEGSGASGGASGASNGVQNGGGAAGACSGASCLEGEADASACSNGSCQPPSCSDGARNQDERGIDCGGSACVPCPCTYGAPEVLGDPNYPGNGLYSPSLSPNGLTLYFGLYVGAATEAVAYSTRAAIDQPFSIGNLLPGSLNASIEGTPRVASDDLTLYFYSERAGGLGGRDIYRAQRTTPTANFDAITPLTEINSTGADHLPWVGSDQLSMYFTSDRAGNLDIYRSVRASLREPWGAPAAVTELNSTELENGATLSADEREILFVSTRRGGADLFRAVRAPGESSFRAPEYLPSISSAAEDADPALSPDGTELYFSSTRDGTDSRLWRVSRTCP